MTAHRSMSDEVCPETETYTHPDGTVECRRCGFTGWDDLEAGLITYEEPWERKRGILVFTDDEGRVLCGWSVSCSNLADGYVEHPVLGPVPTCQFCATHYDLELHEGEVVLSIPGEES